ncbi:hypothetical protein SK128_000855 [Halocaridina rubra]|uniref:Uncharacterized protein n=1 Tax=Halocaridina rubra TaxID=373956 RepID=A0AAN9A7A5_HALRR
MHKRVLDIENDFYEERKIPTASQLAANAARNNLLSMQLIRNKEWSKSSSNSGEKVKNNKLDEVEAMTMDSGSSKESKFSSDGESDGSSVSSSSSAAASTSRSKKRKRTKKPKKRIPKLKGKGDDSMDVFSKLILETGGFFLDSSEFGTKLRNLVQNQDYSGLARYAITIIDSKSIPMTQMLVANLIELIIRQREQIDELKKYSSGDGGEGIGQKTPFSSSTVAKHSSDNNIEGLTGVQV